MFYKTTLTTRTEVGLVYREFMMWPLRGEGPGGPTPYGKNNLTFPFWWFEYLPNLVMTLTRLHFTLCWLIPDWFRRKAHCFTQCLLLMSQGSVFNYILTLYKIQVMEDLGNKKMAHHMITSLHFCVVDIPCSPMMDSKGRIFIDRDGALFRLSNFKKEINWECQQCILVRMIISSGMQQSGQVHPWLLAQWEAPVAR